MAKRWIRIWNEDPKGTDRRYLELLGAGTKRDDEATIGMFGSGSMYAPLMQLRNGGEYVVCAHDDRGPYRIDYKVDDSDEFNVVVFDYGTEQKRSSFTLDAGAIGWNEPHQLLREPIANAIDAHTQFGVDWDVDTVDEIVERPGYFDVYIGATKELLTVVDNLDRYFVMAGGKEPLFSNKNGDIYPAVDSHLRIYYKGVLVYQEDTKSLYSYSLNDVKLTEERTVKDTYSMKMDIVRALIAKCDVPTLVERYIKNWGDNLWEDVGLQAFSWFYDVPDQWVISFEAIHGKRAIPLLKSTSGAALDALKVKGYTPVYVSHLVFEILKEAGVKQLVDVLGEEIKYDFIEPGTFETDVLEQASRIVEFYEPALAECKVKVFRPRAGQDDIYGECTKDTDGSLLIVLNQEVLRNGLHQTVGTLIHEVDHAISKYPDLSREFRNQADQRLATLMIDNYKQGMPYEVVASGIEVPPLIFSKVGGVHYAVKKVGSSVLIDFGSVVFNMPRAEIDRNKDFENYDGVLELSGANALVTLPGSVTPHVPGVLTEVKL